MIALVIGVAIAIGVSIIATLNTTQVPNTESTDDPRTIFWRHVHGLGIDPSDKSILYIATHGDFYQSKVP